MARTNLHELATRLLRALETDAADGQFEGKLRAVATTAGLNSVRSAEAIKLLEELGRIDVVQRGRRGRDTIISIKSHEPVSLADAERMLPGRAARKQTRITYDEIGKAVVDRLLELGRNDALRAAQVDVFEAESRQARQRVTELEGELQEATERETSLRIKLRAAEDALTRAEENLQKVFGPGPHRDDARPAVEDDDARAVLDILRSAGS